ncbi:abc transporter [Colletotrichum incanum]|uniref:Abc transporter n=1 Tax=Colletotrichum incanum TaxID=1573173 RepID=A0A167CQG2_COLIC|nr:abc transporter [Colletotrichum incanum]
MAELGGWWPWVKKFSIFWKYVWPVGQPMMQIVAISSILLAFVNKILTALSSHYLGRLVTKLSEAVEKPTLRRAEVLPPLLRFAITYALTTDAAIPTLRSGLFMIINIHREQNIRGAIHEKIMSLGFSFHNTVNSADTIRIANNSKGFLNALDTVFLVLAPNMFMLMIPVGFLVLQHGPFMALILLWLVVCYFIGQRRSAKRLPRELDRYMALRRDMDADCLESVRCWETITSDGKTAAAIERHHSKVAEWVKQWFRWLTPYYVGQFMTGMVLIVIFFFGLLLVLNDFFNKRATAGDFAAFVAYWNNIIVSLNNFKDNKTDIIEKLLQATRGRRLLEMPAQVKDAPKFEFRGGAIRFNGVTCDYGHKEDAVLKDLDLQIAAGTKLTIIGESGCGKSTLMRLLLGLLQPSSGHIQVDDQRIENIDIMSLRARIGFIGQNTSLFGCNIMDNMLYMNPDVTEDQVFEACEKACIHDAIINLPNGYRTKLGADGQAFSDGQRQRLRIARMLLQNPNIIVLDEALSALDGETKASVQKAIREEFKNNTLIQIEWVP